MFHYRFYTQYPDQLEYSFEQVQELVLVLDLVQDLVMVLVLELVLMYWEDHNTFLQYKYIHMLNNLTDLMNLHQNNLKGQVLEQVLDQVLHQGLVYHNTFRLYMYIHMLSNLLDLRIQHLSNLMVLVLVQRQELGQELQYCNFVVLNKLHLIQYFQVHYQHKQSLLILLLCLNLLQKQNPQSHQYNRNTKLVAVQQLVQVLVLHYKLQGQVQILADKQNQLILHQGLLQFLHN